MLPSATKNTKQRNVYYAYTKEPSEIPKSAYLKGKKMTLENWKPRHSKRKRKMVKLSLLCLENVDTGPVSPCIRNVLFAFLLSYNLGWWDSVKKENKPISRSLTPSQRTINGSKIIVRQNVIYECAKWTLIHLIGSWLFIIIIITKRSRKCFQRY